MLISRFAGLLAALMIWAPAAPLRAQPLGTAFTYQGMLKIGGSPANGLHDLRFRLCDAAAGGSQVGATLCSDDVSVIDGLFAVSLDFGPQFAGSQRFLEIEVRANTGLDCGTLAGFTILGPRQPLSATPYALHALNASISGTQSGAVNFTNAANAYAGSGALLTSLNASNIASGTLGSAHLAGLYANAIAFSHPSNVFAGDGAGLLNVDAATLNGFEADDFLQSIPSPLLLSSSSAILPTIRGTNTSSAAGVSAVSGVATVNGAINYGVYGQSDSTNGFGVRGVANVSGPQPDASAGVYGSSSSSDGTGVRGRATGPFSTGVEGIVNDATAFAAVYGEATHTSGSASGVRGTTHAAGGAGVRGYALDSNAENFGVYGESTSGFGFGVRGVADTSNEQTPSAGVFGSSSGVGGLGVRGDAYGFLGIGVQGTVSDANASAGVFGNVTAQTGSASGVLGISESSSGRGVQGVVFASTGTNYGVYGRSSSTAGVGTYGESTANSGTTRGVYGVSESTSGRGVQGYASAASGTTYGVFGRADSGTGYGVYGQTVPTTANNYAVYASGNSGASGTKSFRIDHPADPANKYLLHYSAESDEVINFYSGKVSLNGAGEAVVDLPAYFALINKDPRYTLTAIGAAMPNLHIAVEVDEASLALGERAEPGQVAPPCWFKIAGGAPGAKVSWRIDALRNDRWIRQHAAPVEVGKPEGERGSIEHAELYAK